MDYDGWIKRRRYTTKIFYIEGIALGMEYVLTFVTLYVYLIDVLKTKYVVLYYSLISAIFIMSQVIASLILGRLFDRYRNLRTMFFIGNVLIITGNIMYTIPKSPLLLFFGRLISGGGGSLRAIMTSETTRSYPESEHLEKFSAMGMAFAVGFIFGPAINFAFVKADFWFLGIHVNYVNGSGLVLVFVFIIVQILAMFFVSDLSKEFDRKEEYSMKNEDEQEILENENIEETTPITTSRFKSEQGAISTIKELFCQTDICLIFVFSFFFMHCMVCYDIWQPMVCIQLMKWNILEINIINFGYGLVAAVVLLVVAYKPPSDKRMIHLAIVCIVCLGCIQVMYLTLKLYNESNGLNIALWIFYTIWFAILVIMEEVFLIGTMARMVESRIQAFAESVRLSCSRIGAVLGLLTAAFSFTYLQYICTSYLVFTCIILALLFWRRKSFQNPRILV